MIAKKIAIIGGGPNSVYAIEIFLKTVLKKNKKKNSNYYYLIAKEILDMEIPIVSI